MFEKQISTGDLSPQAGLLVVYGQYLANGGTPEGFMSMDEDDIQIMYTVHEAMKFADEQRNMKQMGKLLQSIGVVNCNGR